MSFVYFFDVKISTVIRRYGNKMFFADMLWQNFYQSVLIIDATHIAYFVIFSVLSFSRFTFKTISVFSLSSFCVVIEVKSYDALFLPPFA